ncbi:hypothetical protein LAZ67_5001305 [Cordylochernes scorpioides]|uniref:Uncharacterized protein n=1 Tax=Cordylochernes scorpioides TaxID=51811 RepID=A0ABY6KFI1_9ARAC|nr:hypothetical protein LAZ67_5001305 [Cordylochernes scorpioides]
MTSFGAENQTHSVTFPTTFSIQGQVYHRIGSLMPSENQPSRFLQIYFMGNAADDDIQTDRRCQQIQGVRRNIVQGLQRMLHHHNLLVQQFRTALENLPSDAYRVVVNADRTPPGQHPRRYNAPTANEVAVVLADDRLLRHVQRNCLRFFGHIARHRGIEYTILTGKTFGRRIPGRPSTRFVDQSKELSGLKVTEMVHRAQNRDGWRRFWDQEAKQLKYRKEQDLGFHNALLAWRLEGACRTSGLRAVHSLVVHLLALYS